MSARLLEVRNVHSGYGRVPIVRGVDLKVNAGEVTLILGANGAGKSTLLRTIAGFIKPTRGSVWFAGRDVTSKSPEVLARDGLRLVLDGHRIFPEITVADNIRLGAPTARARLPVEELAEEVLSVFPILREKLAEPARNLSGGQQQMLALAQAFVSKPQVLLCDEPSLGLAQALLPPILDFLRNWADRGIGLLIVEQQIEAAMAVADQVIVVEQGQIRLSGRAQDLRSDNRIHDIYLGVHE